MNISNPYAIFNDLSGNPLEAGMIYIGVANQNPETNPLAVYWDSALTQPAAQPLKTIGGMIARDGNIATAYVSTDFSITVRDKRGNLICTYPQVTVDSVFPILADVTNVNNGDAKIAVAAPYTGGIARTQHQKNLELMTVRDFGGNPDNATDNYSAVLNLRNALGGAGTLKFPYIQGSQNIYKFTTSSYLIFDNMTIDVDEGVSLSFPDDGFFYTTAVYKIARPFKGYNYSLNYYTWISERRNRPLSGKDTFLSSADIDAHTLKPIICNTDLEHKSVGWPNGDTFSAAVPTATSVSGVQWSSALTNNFNMSMIRVQPGDEISCYFDGIVNVPIITAMVRGESGYGGVYSSVDDIGSGTQIFRKDVGQTATNVDIGYYGKGTHASYAGGRSIWTIRIVTWSTYVVLLNGMQIAIGQINGPISEAGFGMYRTDTTSQVTTQDWVIRRYNSVNGISTPLNLAIFGDSISANRYECWPNYMREFLEGTLGIRVVSLTNRAISGDNMAGQWNQMNTLGIAGAGIVVVQVGTNDIQGLTNKASFQANLLNMYNYCKANGATIIFGLPPQFYTQGQAGSRGQASSNYEKGAYIRAAIQRFCADNGLRCVDTGQVCGPMLANYVNAGLNPYWGNDIQNDPMLMDNIHPSPVMEKLLALAYAKAVAGAMATQGNNYYPGSLFALPTNLPSSVMRNNWAIITETPRWYSDDYGNIGFSGVIDKSTGVLTDGTLVMVLPKHLWPKQNKRVVCATSNFTKPCMLQIQSSNGNVNIYGVDASVTYIYLDGMVWNIKQA